MKRYFIDASLFKESNCWRKIYNILIQGYKKKEKCFKMEYGTGFHKFRAEYKSTGNFDLGVQLAMGHYTQPDIIIPKDDHRTSGHLFQTCLAYKQKYPFASEQFKVLQDSQGLACVEKKFIYPFCVNQELDIEIILAGTIDAIEVDSQSLDRVIVDAKTSSSWDAIEYLDLYKENYQLKFYTYIVQKCAALWPDTFGEMQGTRSMIDGVFLSKSGCYLRRSELIEFGERKMEMFELALRRFISSFIDRLSMLDGGFSLDEAFPYNFNSCQTPYGTCPMFKACSAIDVETETEYLEADFIRSEYNPLLFQT